MAQVSSFFAAGWLTVAVLAQPAGWERFGGPILATSFRLPPATLAEVSPATISELASIDELLKSNAWDEAVERLRRLISQAETALIEVRPGTFTTLRRLCHAKIAELPPEALSLYRQRVDALAESRLREARSAKDRAALASLVDEFYCSSAGDDALLLLGELALERGDYFAARHWWEQIDRRLRGPAGRPVWLAIQHLDFDADWPQIREILDAAGDTSQWLAYPDSALELSLVRARLVLVSIRAQQFDRAAAELKLFAKLHPQAEGWLGGRRVVFAEKLRELLASARAWPEPLPEDRWPTFAANNHRTGHGPASVAVAGLAWEQPIELPESAEPAETLDATFGNARIAEPRKQRLSVHPVVAAGVIYFSDGRTVYAFEAATGKPAFGRKGVIYRAQRPARGGAKRQVRQRVGTPRHTLSLAGDRLYARMGSPLTSRPTPRRLAGDECLVALDLSRQGMLVFKVEPDDEDWAFEGAPLADDERVFIAMRKSDVQSRLFVACFSARNGELLWRQFVASGRGPSLPGAEIVTNNLLTKVGETIFYNTNLGVVAALDAQTGTPRWQVRYQRTPEGDAAQLAAHFHRDLTPAVFAEGMLLLAPSDSRFIFALDASTGVMLWATDLPRDAVQLLGVVDGTLIASGHRLWWIDIKTGKVRVRQWPDSRQPGVRGVGRGCIAGEEILWPTHDHQVLVFPANPPLHNLEDEEGPPRVQPLRRIQLTDYGLTSGNLVAAEDLLIVAMASRIQALAQFPRKRPEIEYEARHRPDDAAAQRQFARCALAMKDFPLAWQQYAKALQAGMKQRQPGLAIEIRDEWGRAQLAHARQLLADSRSKASGLAALEQAIASDVLPANKRDALLLIAQVHLGNHDCERAIAAWQRILTDKTLREAPVAVSAEHRVASWLAVQRRLRRLPESYGEDALVTLEHRARAAWHASATMDLVTCHDLARRFPFTAATKEGLSTAQAQAKSDADATILQRYQRESQTPREPTSLPAATPAAYGSVALGQFERDYSLPQALPSGLSVGGQTCRWLEPVDGSWRSTAWPSPSRHVARNAAGEWLEVTDRGANLLDSDKNLLRELIAWPTTPVASPRIAEFTPTFALLHTDDRVSGSVLPRGERWEWKPPVGEVIRRVSRVGKSWIAIEVGPKYQAAPTKEGRTVFIRADSGHVLTGPEVLQRRWERAPISYLDGRALFLLRDGHFVMLDLATQTALWERTVEVLPATRADAVTTPAGLLLFDGLGRVQSVSEFDGSPLWPEAVSLGPQVLTHPRDQVAVADAFLFAVVAGRLMRVEISTGRVNHSPLDLRQSPAAVRWRQAVRASGDRLDVYPLEATASGTWRLLQVDTQTLRITQALTEENLPDGPLLDAWTSGELLLLTDEGVRRIRLDQPVR